MDLKWDGLNQLNKIEKLRIKANRKKVAARGRGRKLKIATA